MDLRFFPGWTLGLELLKGVKWAESGGKLALFSQHGIAHGFERGAKDPSRSGSLQHHRQVHGVSILEAHPERSAPVAAERAAADGIYSRRPGERIAVKTADCLPVLLAAKDRSLVMAVHAGWRGLTGGILPAAVALAGRLGVAADALLVGIGPAISREAFEVGPEVVEALAAPPAGLSKVQAALATAKGRGDRWHVDLVVAAISQAMNAGVPALQIEAMQSCTVKEAERWHSYRRETAAQGALGGSNWSWIEL